MVHVKSHKNFILQAINIWNNFWDQRVDYYVEICEKSTKKKLEKKCIDICRYNENNCLLRSMLKQLTILHSWKICLRYIHCTYFCLTFDIVITAAAAALSNWCVRVRFSVAHSPPSSVKLQQSLNSKGKYFVKKDFWNQSRGLNFCRFFFCCRCLLYKLLNSSIPSDENWNVSQEPNDLQKVLLPPRVHRVFIC